MTFFDRLRATLSPDKSQVKAMPGDMEMRALAAQLDRLIGESFALHARVLNAFDGAKSLDRTLSDFFAVQPTTGEESKLSPYQFVTPAIQIGFESGSEVSLEARPKEDFRLSPEKCLNTLIMQFNGTSKWLTLEISTSWEEIRTAQSFQLGLYARPSRPLKIQAALRLPWSEGAYRDHHFASADLEPGERAANRSGTLRLPPLENADFSRLPKLLLSLDTREHLHLQLDYLTAYFV